MMSTGGNIYGKSIKAQKINTWSATGDIIIEELTSDNINTETINGIKMFLSILPAIAALVSVLFVCFYPLGENKVKVIISELNLKRENKK